MAAFPVLLATGTAAGQTSLTALYDFRGVEGDGSHPIGDITMDAQGVLYGVTIAHGGGGAKIYKMIPPLFAGGEWTKVTLYNGNAPGTVVHGNFTPLTLGRNGELYGVADACDFGLPHQGCIFQLLPPVSPDSDWSMNLLSYQYGFQFGNGGLPVAGRLAIDKAGSLYGITHRRAQGLLGNQQTYGTIYQLSPGPGNVWTRTVLYNFQRFPPPNIGFWEPQDGLVIDQNGVLYGSTTRGRVVFQLTPPAITGGPWGISVLNTTYRDMSGLALSPSGGIYAVAFVDFVGFRVLELKRRPDSGGNWTTSLIDSGVQGAGPGWELVSDRDGALYGTDMTAQTVYKLTPPTVAGGTWTHAVLHSFAGGTEGSDPFGRLLIDPLGNLFGATLTGGTGNRCHNYVPYLAGCGTVFELQ